MKYKRIVLNSVAASLLIATATFAGMYTAAAPVRGHDKNPQVDACVVLLHGLCRSERSMLKIQHRLKAAGYTVINLDYTSTQKPVEEIAATWLNRTVADCRKQGYQRIHFVTHSLGGLVVRAYLQDHRLPAGSRVVMLAPPNQGSELADTALEYFPKLYALGGGPAAAQLRTDGLLVNQGLQPVQAEIGIIAGSLSFNPVFSRLLPGMDDGKVAVQRTRLPEMKDFLVLPTNHTLILWDEAVARQILSFLETGSFSRHNTAVGRRCRFGDYDTMFPPLLLQEN
jgi:triacylglycerol lipase